ncbi:sacsin N-terminal ATP-binding-like domain-containing protein [Nostoc sp. UHCC 0252]|uniref:sacsin N-terminal ATP-binding-like domain-containing protein n=1 Tax=Nostoc sp. UHCC 0252 TaxID=3110241 RepID=UPI002B21E6D7|nr:hypothetical protein [Nostoc sp. UHCC 0252]MEA5604654.1 hypothetical protein [Nostoc sp. UHCC 0252]
MRIKSVKQLRKWIVEKQSPFSALTQNGSQLPDYIQPDFMGCKDKNSSGEEVVGFFSAYHGMKSNIANFLATGLQNAEDGQAIYEFLQNAADCESDDFYIFYNEKFFLALNNGIEFKLKDVVSILNTSQSSKSDNTNQAVDCDKIGRFGIGFKLVHRLVGENEGLKELTEEYKGPILFSWSQPEHLEALLNITNVQQIEYDDNLTGEYPWLFKILITNFPAQPFEEIKDLSYKNKVAFTEQEFSDFLHFLKKNQSKLELSKLQRGSLFFLNLGEGKSQALDKHYENDLEKGVECSLNMLKSLKTVMLKDKYIQKLTLKTLEFKIAKDSDAFSKINPTDKKCDIKFLFGYLPYKRSEELRVYPNFYKYFPMGAEEHGLSFILHCDAFKIETNRRELEELPTNKAIFKWFVSEFINKLEQYIENKPDDFRELYANILLSCQPSKDWINESLYQPLKDYISGKIPTDKGNFYSREKVYIKNTALKISPIDFGIQGKEWFYWNKNSDKELVDQVSLQSWKIEDLIIQGDVEFINKWIASTQEKVYMLFLKELNGINDSIWKDNFVEKFCYLKIFKFTDSEYYSINDIKTKPSYLLICSQDILALKNILKNKLGFLLSKINLADYQKVVSKLEGKLEEHLGARLFTRIAERTSIIAYNSILLPKDKENIFKFLRGLKQSEKLKKLIFFKDSFQTLKPLNELLSRNIVNLATWLQAYQIDDKEYFPQLDIYLLKESEIYEKLIYRDWEKIIGRVEVVFNTNNIEQFYQDINRYFADSENKSPLTEYPYIFTDDGFKQIAQVFYSKHLGEVQSYNDLKVAISCLTNLQLPEKNILKFLSHAPFKTNQDKLEDVIESIGEESAELEQSVINNLIEFTAKNGEVFFNQFCISYTKESGIYVVTNKSNKNIYPYYTEKLKLKEYIERHLSDELKALPAEFYNERGNNQGLLKDSTLYLELLEKYFSDELIEELISVVKESGIKDVEKGFLQCIPSLTLVQKKAYKKSSYEYQVLELACEYITGDESLQEEFKNKVRVIDQERRVYPLREAVKDEIIFTIGDEIYELSLSEILPRYQDISGIVDKMLKQFKGLTTKLKTLFGIGETNIMNEEVYEELKQEFTHLENAHQLAFVVLYAKSKNNIKLLDEFTVDTGNE